MKLLPRTQDHLDIIDVKDDILILTGGRFRLVLEANAINFDLLSEDEQNATIYAYATLVNSIEYPIQIVIRTRQVDVTSYLKFLEVQIHEQPSVALREQLRDYSEFIQRLVVENTVLSKRFFVILPFYSRSTSGTNSNPLSGIFPFGKKTATATSTSYSKATLEKAKTDLNQKFEDLKWQFNRLGIKVKKLNTEELVRLYYEIYNPEAGENEGINQDIYGYTTSTVVSSLSDMTRAQVAENAKEKNSRKESNEPTK